MIDIVKFRLKTALRAGGTACLLTLLFVGCSEEPSEQASAPTADAQHENHQSEARAPELKIVNAYVRQPAPGQPVLAAYVTFKNPTDHAYRLEHVSSPKAGTVDVHRTIYEEGVMAMRHVHQLTVQPQSELVFEPGGYHLMLSELEGEFNPGDQVPLHFVFEGGSTLDVDAEVRALQ